MRQKVAVILTVLQDFLTKCGAIFANFGLVAGLKKSPIVDGLLIGSIPLPQR